MKTCSLLCSCLLHSLCPSNSCKSTGCTEHIHCYCAVIRPPARVLSVHYATREATENSLCPKGCHTIPSAPPPAQSTRAFVLFSASYATRRVGCMGAMGFPIQFLHVIRPGCSCSERQDQGKLFWTPVAPGLEHAQMFHGMALADQSHTGVYWLEVKVRNTRNNSSTTWLFKEKRNEHNVQIARADNGGSELTHTRTLHLRSCSQDELLIFLEQTHFSYENWLCILWKACSQATVKLCFSLISVIFRNKTCCR